MKHNIVTQKINRIPTKYHFVFLHFIFPSDTLLYQNQYNISISYRKHKEK